MIVSSPTATNYTHFSLKLLLSNVLLKIFFNIYLGFSFRHWSKEEKGPMPEVLKKLIMHGRRKKKKNSFALGFPRIDLSHADNNIYVWNDFRGLLSDHDIIQGFCHPLRFYTFYFTQIIFITFLLVWQIATIWNFNQICEPVWS